MASEVTASISTKETANYARLCRLLVDVGTLVLRTTFDKVYQPEKLGTFLSRKPIHSVLLSLRKKQVLNTHQWGKLYPQSLVSSQHFDITLVMVLLKNICGLVPPTSGWDLPPPSENTTTVADIVRITYFRDIVYSYARRAAVDDKTFNLYWKDITDVLVRLGGTCYQNAINSIKTGCMDSHFEKHYRELLKNWFQDDDTIKKREGRAEGKLEATRLELTIRAVVTELKCLKKKCVARISSKSEKSTEIIHRNREKGHLDGVEGKFNRTQPNKKFCKDERSEEFAGARDVRLQGRSVGEKKMNRLQSKDVYLAKENCKVIDKIVLALDRAINYHQSDQIADARNALISLFVVLLNIQLQDLEVPNEDGWLWEVLAWGKELFLEGGVSCSIKHGTLLLDSSYVGQKYLQEKIRSSPINQVSSPNDSSIRVEEFYLSVLNVLGAFALLISELEIAHETFELLVDFHHQLATSNSPLQDLGAAYNNKGCISLVKGDFCLATEEFKKSLSYVESRKLRQLERLSTDTESVAVYSNISRLHLISRNFNEALELQEQLENDCEAREINELPFQTIFMMMNNRVVLYTSLGNFNKAEKALRRLKSYCNRMKREDCNSLLNFVRLHLCEALLLQGKTREAEEEFSLKKLSSTSFTDLVDMFGSLYMNVRIEALEKLAEIFVRRGQIQIALSLLEKTVEIIETSFGSNHLNLASLLFKQGSILSLTGDLISAAGKFKSSADILQMIFGQGNPLLIKCYMSLGELKSRLEHKEESHLYFQRAVKSLEVLYHVSFENELSTTYMEITKKLKKSSRSEVSEMMIEGLVAEHGQALAVLLRENNPQEEALRRSKTGKKLVSGERLENECLDSKIVISQKYAIDFLQTGQKLLRQGMKEEAAAFFEQAGAHCEDHRSKQGHLNAELVRMHSLLLQKHSGELTADQDVNNTLEELSKEIEENEKWSKVKETTREVTTAEFDHQFNLKLFLIFLIMMSIELKEIDTTFAAYDLYTKLSPYETEFHILLNDGIQVFASKTLVTCNGKTAFQDVLVSSTIGPDESIAECPTPEEQVFRSLSYKTNTSSNGFLAACSSPVILDIDELLVLKRSVSLAFKECFQLKRFESEHEDVGTQIIVDLTSTTMYGHCSITSYGSRIELLPLCLTEDFQVGISQEQSIFEIQTSMWQDTKCMIFADEQTSSYMFKITVLNLLQQCRSDKTLTLAIQSHSISVAIRQPVKARLALSHDKRSIKQRIKFVATATAKKTATALGIKGCDTQKYFEASCPKIVADVLSWPGIDTSAKKYQVAYQSGIHLEDPLDDPVAENNKVPPELKSSENDSKSSLKNSVLQCLIEVDELSRLLDEEPSPVQDDDNESLGPIGDEKRFKDTASQTQTGQQELIPREDNDVSLVDLNGGQSTFLGGQLYQDPIPENSQQSETTSGDGSQSHCPTLKAPGCALIESSLQTHEENFTQRAEDSDETCMGKLLFESDRKSRRSLMAEFQRSLNRRKSKFKESSFNFEQNGDEVSIDSNRPYTSCMFSLKESQKTNDSIVDYIGNPHFQHQAKEKNQSSKFYSERECDSFEAIEVAKIDEGAPTVPKLIKDPESPAPSISNTQHLTSLKILSKSKRLKDGDSSLKDEESRVINENFKAIDESKTTGSQKYSVNYLVLEDTDVVDGPLRSCDFERESSNGQERFGKHYSPSSSRASPVMKPVCRDASFRYPYQDDGTFSTLSLPNVQAEERSRESTHALDTDCEAQRKQIERDWLSGAHSFINSQDSSNPEEQLKSKLLENEKNNSSERSLQNDFLIHSNHGIQDSDENETKLQANEAIPNCSEKISQGFPSKAFSCKPEDVLKEEAIAPVTYNDHGGARPKRKLNDSRKGMIIPTKTNSRSYPIFVARHFNDDRNPDFCINAGNCDHASVEGHQQDDHNRYFLLSTDHGSFSFGEKDASCEEGYTQSCHVSDEGRISCSQRDLFVTKNRFMPQSSPLSQTERPSLSSRVCDEDLSLLPSRRYCVDEGDPVIPEPKSSFNSPYSRDAVNSVKSTMNKYDRSTKNTDCGLAQISTSAEDEVSLIEHSSGFLLGSLQQIMAQTVQLVASSVTPPNKAQCTLQSVEKVGIQENARNFRELAVSIPSPINESSNQEVFTQVNESTLGADREQQSIAIPVQETPRPVCSHYQRRCLVRFPCCGKFFPCHRCHNESDCTEDQARAINATHIRCTICYNEQVIDENSQRCGSCNSKMSEYFCATCKHFTSVDKNPFHCTKCGICRIHSDRSFHCDVCNVCLDKRLEGKHKCRPDSGHDECCICLEDAFSGCQILPCSHKVHKDCAIAMIQNGVRTCPICRHPLFGQLQTSPQ